MTTKALAKTKPSPPAIVDKEATALRAEMVDDVLKIAGGEAEHRALMEGLASECPYYSALMLKQLLGVLADGSGPSELTNGLRCASELLRGFDPQNTLEAMVAVQGVCAHMAATALTRRTIKAEMIPQMEANGNLANKFMRTFVAQMEGLSRLRRKGEQVVKHVHVNEGGQAVIAGTVTTGGRGR